MINPIRILNNSVIIEFSIRYCYDEISNSRYNWILTCNNGGNGTHNPKVGGSNPPPATNIM